MESPVYAPPGPSSAALSYHQHHHHHSSDPARPSLGFPLGTALLLIVIFSLSGIFSCCYHWDKFRSLRRSYAAAAAAAAAAADGDLESGGGASADKAKTSLLVRKDEAIRSVPVIMPGDDMPRFIALPCPCEPLRPEKPSSVAPLDPKPPKPPTSPDRAAVN